jgi:hypothetical protein
MTRLTFLIFGLFLWISLPSTAQEIESPGLILQHQTKDKSKFIPENKKVTLINNRGFKSSGKLEVISDEEVLVKGRRFNVNELATVKRNLIWTKVTGAVIFVAGRSVLAVILNNSRGSHDLTTGEIFFPEYSAPGLIIMGSAIPFLLYTPTYKQSKWAYKLIPTQENLVQPQ